MVLITVMYPNQEGSRFDKDYYLHKHIPLVRERFGPLGLLNVSLFSGIGGGAPDAAATYQVMAHVTFDSLESFHQAASAHGEEVFGDIPNFTDVEPVVQVNEELA